MNAATANKKATEPKAIGVVRASTIIQKWEPEFLWYPYIGKGNVTVLYGESCRTRDLFIYKLLSDVSAGRPLPGMDATTALKKETVLYLNSADHMEYSAYCIRLHEGNTKNVYFAEPCDATNNQWYLLLAKDIDLLEQLLTKLKPSLVVIDDWSSLVSFNYSDYLKVLLEVVTKVSAIAQKFDCSIVLCDFAVERCMGGGTDRLDSLKKVFSGQSVLCLYPDLQDRECVLLQSKASFTDKGKSLHYTILDKTIEWDGYSNLTNTVVEQPRTNKLIIHDWIHGCISTCTEQEGEDQ